jgi:hypothetical protein
MKDCLYLVENRPDLFARVKKFILTHDSSDLPKYMKELEYKLKAEKTTAQRQAIKLTEAIAYIDEHAGDGKGRLKGLERGLGNIMSSHWNMKHPAKRISLDARIAFHVREYHSMLTELMSRVKPRKVGLDRSLEFQDELVRALYGTSKDPDAILYGKAISKVFDRIVDDYNAAGGHITKLPNFRLPQHSDPMKLGKVTFNEWANDIRGWVDSKEMAEQIAQRLNLDDASKVTENHISESLKRAYDSQRTRGLSDMKPGELDFGMRESVEKRHMEHRFFHFADADSWIAYNKKYGAGDPYPAITGHIDRLAREIAAMETLGPNPEKNLKYLVDMVKKETNDPHGGKFAYDMYRNAMNQLEGVGNPNKVFSALQDARNVLTATKLPMAMFSAFSDTYFMGSAAKLNGMSATKVYKNMFKMLNPLNEADRKFAGQLYLGMEYALDAVHQHNRFSLLTGNNWSARMADVGLRTSGLTHWTHAGKQAFGFTYMSHLADMAKFSFDDLPAPVRASLDRYGINAGDWAHVQASKKLMRDGIEFLDPAELADRDTMAKIVGMVYEETLHAVPEPNLRVKTIMNQGIPSNTPAGEAIRSVTQFKSFTATVLINELGRRFSQGGVSGFSSLGSMALFTTIIGAYAYNLKEIARGRTPYSWDSKEFWWNGFIQGGSASLIGDVLFMDPNKQGSVTEFLAGPLVGEINDILLNFLVKPAHELVNYERGLGMRMVDRAIRQGERYLPPPLQMPGMKLMIQRTILDNIHKLTDEKYAEKNRRFAKELQQRGQSQYWKPPQ